MSLRVASFTVRATQEQVTRWNRAASGEGHRAVGTWLAAAADAYLRVRATAGAPVPLAWHRGAFRVTLEDGSTPTLRGSISDPFGLYRGTAAGPVHGKSYVLVYLPSARIVATLRSAAHCKGLAAELARVWVRWNGEGGREPPPSDTGPLLERFRREDV
ncbi:MAG: hypothetical protein QOJ16_1019 [Acidobacteriota bacterium]|jgi:hypothetical protein|nr:hypothetical protein [Acidobacteriota bacterium]